MAGKGEGGTVAQQPIHEVSGLPLVKEVRNDLLTREGRIGRGGRPGEQRGAAKWQLLNKVQVAGPRERKESGLRPRSIGPWKRNPKSTPLISGTMCTYTIPLDRLVICEIVYAYICDRKETWIFTLAYLRCFFIIVSG